MDSVLIIKVVSALLYPLNLFFLLILVYFLLRVLRRPRTANLSLLCAFIVLILASNPMIASNLVRSLESRYPQVDTKDIAPHQAILVLGGGLRNPIPPAKHIQLTSGSDRYWYAAHLFKAGKAKQIVLAGGNVFAQPGIKGEAHYASILLQQWGVPASAIHIETASRTTEQNKLNIESKLSASGINQVLLVTSGYHMPRAIRIFSDPNISFTPASADVLIRDVKSPAILRWLPSSYALGLTRLALHEYYGMWYLNIRK